MYCSNCTNIPSKRWFLGVLNLMVFLQICTMLCGSEDLNLAHSLLISMCSIFLPYNFFVKYGRPLLLIVFLLIYVSVTITFFKAFGNDIPVNSTYGAICST